MTKTMPRKIRKAASGTLLAAALVATAMGATTMSATAAQAKKIRHCGGASLDCAWTMSGITLMGTLREIEV